MINYIILYYLLFIFSVNGYNPYTNFLTYSLDIINISFTLVLQPIMSTADDFYFIIIKEIIRKIKSNTDKIKDKAFM